MRLKILLLLLLGSFGAIAQTEYPLGKSNGWTNSQGIFVHTGTFNALVADTASVNAVYAAMIGYPHQKVRKDGAWAKNGRTYYGFDSAFCNCFVPLVPVSGGGSTYTAGSGLGLSSTQFYVDTIKIASFKRLSDSMAAVRAAVIAAGYLTSGSSLNATNLLSGTIPAARYGSATIDVSKLTGTLPKANGGTGTTTPGSVAGTNVTITGTWPNETINSSGGGSSYTFAYGLTNTSGTVKVDTSTVSTRNYVDSSSFNLIATSTSVRLINIALYHKATAIGLNGQLYQNGTQAGAFFTQSGDTITITNGVDSFYNGQIITIIRGLGVADVGFDLIVYDGQSNVGTNWQYDFNASTHSAEITRLGNGFDPMAEFQRVWIWAPDLQKFIRLRWGYPLPIGHDGFGADISIATRWTLAHPTGQLFLVRGGHSGQPIAYWTIGQAGWDTLTADITAAKAALNGFGIHYNLPAFLWDQWETDDLINTPHYQDSLTIFMQRLTAGGYITAQTKRIIVADTAATIYPQQAGYIASDPSARLINAHGFPTLIDGIHYMGRSQYFGVGWRAYNWIYGTADTSPVPLVPTTTSLTYTPAYSTLLTNLKHVIPPSSTIQWNDSNWWYFGLWQALSGSNFYGNDTSTFVACRFQGQSFTFNSAKVGGGAFPAKSKVYIDNVLVDSIIEASIVGTDITRTYSGLDTNIHTFRIQSYNGYIWMLNTKTCSTGAQGGGGWVPTNGYPIVTPPLVCTDTNVTNIYYNGSWASGGAYGEYTFTYGDYAELNIHGTGVAVDLSHSASFNDCFDVMIDGVTVQTNNYTDAAAMISNSQPMERYTIGGLSLGDHTIRITAKTTPGGHTGTSILWFKQFRVLSATRPELIIDPVFAAAPSGSPSTGWVGSSSWTFPSAVATVGATSGFSGGLETTITGLTIGVQHVFTVWLGGDTNPLYQTSSNGSLTYGSGTIVGGGIGQVFIFTPTATTETVDLKTFNNSATETCTHYSIKKL